MPWYVFDAMTCYVSDAVQCRATQQHQYATYNVSDAMLYRGCAGLFCCMQAHFFRNISSSLFFDAAKGSYFADPASEPLVAKDFTKALAEEELELEALLAAASTAPSAPATDSLGLSQMDGLRKLAW